MYGSDMSVSGAIWVYMEGFIACLILSLLYMEDFWHGGDHFA